jgi:hypothetical protein
VALSEPVRARFGVDRRALAALRIGVGALLLADLVTRAGDLVVFYTDRGVLPRAVLAEVYPVFARLSLHAVAGSALVQAVLFCLAGVAAFALLVGYRTRVVTLISLALLVSLHLRNPVVLNAGDSLLRRLLVWGLFLPLGGRWAVDAGSGAEAEHADSDTRVVSVASAALLTQVVLMYAVNGLFKLRGEAWLEGVALHRVFAVDGLTVLLGNHLAGYPTLLTGFDYLWLGLVLASPLLLVVRGRARTGFVCAFAGGHLAMALTLRLGLFPLVSLVALCPLLPPSVWDRAETGLARTRAQMPVTSPTWRPAGLSVPAWLPVRRRLDGLRRTWGDVRPLVVGLLLVLVLCWNAATLGYVTVDGGVDPAAYAWDMFAPEPRSVDGWYVVEGRPTGDGLVDPFRGGTPTFDRPPDVTATFPSHRWYVYGLDLQRPAGEPLRPAFARYLCDRSIRPDTRLERVTVYYVRAPVDGPTRRVELADRRCPTAGRQV